MSGADLATVKTLRGHRSIQSMMIYTHLTLEHQRKAIEELDRSTTTWCVREPSIGG
jgi:site-specific recombinase XerD